LFKFPNRKKSYSQNASAASSVANSIAGTPEIEARDFRQDLIDSNNRNTFWGRTFGNAFSWINPTRTNNNEQTEPDNYDNSFTNNNNNVNNQASVASSLVNSIPLNAYLTYVTLKLQLIMQGKLINFC
jgi:hypothetical protein